MINSLIIILGIELVKYVDISLMASVGIIKLAIKDDFKKEKILNLDNIHVVLNKNLSKRLKNLNISNVDEIISNLEKVAKNNQSLLAMEAI